MKKFVSMFLSLTLVILMTSGFAGDISLFKPMSIYAEGSATQTENSVAICNGMYYDDLAEALTAAQVGGGYNVTLLKNGDGSRRTVYLNKNVRISEGKFAVDLNGNKIYVNESDAALIGRYSYCISVSDTADVLIKGPGEIFGSESSYNPVCVTPLAIGGGKLEIKDVEVRGYNDGRGVSAYGGELNISGTTIITSYYGWGNDKAINVRNNAVVNINDEAVVGKSNCTCGIIVLDDAEVNINGGSVGGNSGASIMGGVLNFYNGTINTIGVNKYNTNQLDEMGEDYIYTVGVLNVVNADSETISNPSITSGVDIAGGLANIEAGIVTSISVSSGKAEIKNGTIKNITLNKPQASDNSTVSETLIVSGGTVNSLNVKGGTAEITGGKIESLTQNGIAADISGGKVTASGGEIVGGTAVKVSGDGEFSLKDNCVVIGTYASAVCSDGGTTNILGGTLNVTDGEAPKTVCVTNETANVNIFGGIYPNGFTLFGAVISDVLVDGYGFFDKDGKFISPSAYSDQTSPKYGEYVEVNKLGAHNIIIDPDIKNGSVIASDGAAVLGEEVTLITNSAVGSRLNSITVTGSETGTTVLTNNGDGIFTFIMPEEKVTVSAVFEKIDYTIKVDSEIANGTITVSKEIANYGDMITITAAPDSKYEVSLLEVTGNETETNIELTDMQDGTFTFTMPAEDICVRAAFTEIDIVNPEILSVYPPTGETLYNNQKISVSCSDNYRLANLLIEYRHEGEEAWTTLLDENTSKTSGIFSAELDTSVFTDGNYEVKITLKDSEENTAESVVKYKYVECKLSVPELEAVPGGWSVNLSWTMDGTENLAGYNVYRRAAGQENGSIIRRTTAMSYCDKSVTAGQTYEYMIEAVDIYGRVVRGEYVPVTPTNDDSISPVADAGYDKETVVGKALQFDGSKSTDNRGIVSYLWDFGDGYTAEIARPSHIYNEEGTYIVALTVSDGAGNTDTDEIKVNVRGNDYSILTVKAVDKANNAPLSDTMIYCELPGSNVTTYMTDSSGAVSVIAKQGEYDFYFYHEGYLPECKKINVSDLESSATVKLEKKEIVTGEVNIKRLELQQIKDLGIDVTAPENQFVYEYSAQIVIDPTKGPEEIKIITNGSGELINTEEKFVWKPDVSEGEEDNSTCAGGTVYKKVIPNENHPEIPPTVVILNVKMDISWLKEFFEVEMVVINNADTMFPIENASAVLNLPDGLSLAPTAKKQTLEQEIGTINGKSSATRNWIIRGDKAGNYNVSVDFDGTLMPFGETIKAKFVTSEPLTVHGGNALNLDMIYRVTDDMTGIEYAEFELTNASDIDIHNVCVNLAGMITENNVDEIHLEYPSGLLEVIKWSPNGQEGESIIFLPALYGEDADYSRTLKPGQKLRGLLIIKKR